jgi:hypothetical protein
MRISHKLNTKVSKSIAFFCVENLCFLAFYYFWCLYSSRMTVQTDPLGFCVLFIEEPRVKSFEGIYITKRGHLVDENGDYIGPVSKTFPSSSKHPLVLTRALYATCSLVRGFVFHMTTHFHFFVAVRCPPFSPFT